MRIESDDQGAAPSSFDPRQETMSLAEAASFIRIGVDALRELIVVGAIPALSLNQKHWVLLRSDLVEFVRTKARLQQKNREALLAQSRAGYMPEEEPRLGRGRPRNRLPKLID